MNLLGNEEMYDGFDEPEKENVEATLSVYVF